AGGCDEVEPVSLTVGAVVAALVLKGAEKTGEKVTEGGLAAIGTLVDRVLARFRDGGDAAAGGSRARGFWAGWGPLRLWPWRPGTSRSRGVPAGLRGVHAAAVRAPGRAEAAARRGVGADGEGDRDRRRRPRIQRPLLRVVDGEPRARPPTQPPAD